MALIRCDFFSEVLGLSTSMTVLLPQATSAQIGMTGVANADGAPTLYLLHGLSDDCTIWQRRTSIERYAAPLGLAVVMPQVARSFYCDEEHGSRYWTFLADELPTLVEGFFRVSDRREDRFVAGLSMGGYGALKWGLRRPDRFAAAASLSGAVDVERIRATDNPDRRTMIHTVFDSRPITGTDDDLFQLVRSADPKTAPALYIGCGTEDELFDDNERLIALATECGLDVTVDRRPGEHEWGVWDAMIEDVVNWLPLRT